MKNKQSSIEWLIQQFKNKGYIGLQDELQAKQMHKEEIVEAFEVGYDNGAGVNEDEFTYHGTNYYKKIYERKTTEDK